MDIDSNEEGLASSLIQPQPYRRWLSKTYFFREPPFCSLRRWVVFSLFKKVLWNAYALIARTTPFNTSFKNSKKLSMIITSFLLTKERITGDNHPPIKLLAAYLF